MPTEPRSYKPRPDKHRVWSGEEADKECPTEGGFFMVECEDCGVRYAVHCSKCEHQVTQCSCTLPALTKRHEAKNQMVAEEEEKMKNGLWVPPGARQKS